MTRTLGLRLVVGVGALLLLAAAVMAFAPISEKGFRCGSLVSPSVTDSQLRSSIRRLSTGSGNEILPVEGLPAEVTDLPALKAYVAHRISACDDARGTRWSWLVGMLAGAAGVALLIVPSRRATDSRGPE